MDTIVAKSNSINPAFSLSAQQEQLLFKALNSNTSSNTIITNPNHNESFSMAPASLHMESPVQAPGSGTMSGFESPFIDYDYEFDADGSFDYDLANDSQGQMIGKLPGTSSDGDADTTVGHEKRGHEDGDEEEGGGKRKETGKKPGRKPLTSEPTSKRKAQNRAAQRAFRERKEQHLKDLETKVTDLEKASESANHENSILRSQIEKMSVELREYKKRFSLTGGTGRTPPSSNSFPPYHARDGSGNGAASNPNNVNFQFEFPRFGRLPGPVNTSPNLTGTTTYASPTTYTGQIPSPVDRDQVSPRNQSLQSPISNSSNAGITETPTQYGGDMSSLSGLFSPSILESVGKSSPFEFFPNTNGNNNTSNGSRSSSDAPNGHGSTGHNTSYSSPSASSNSNHGADSSCGTSPEPTMQSPVCSKPADSTLTTIGEENTASGEGELTFCDKLNMACGNPNNPVPQVMSEPEPDVDSGILDNTFDINGIDWFAQQNGNLFDPQLFGDYREPQENILAGEAFSDSFFSEAFALPDFSSPYNTIPSPAPPKKDIVAQIDAKQIADEEVVPGEDTSKMLPCHTIWDRLQACPKVKEGEFDLDGLCKDLQKKAKCSETGAVVNESDFNRIMQTYVDGACTTTKAANAKKT